VATRKEKVNAGLFLLIGILLLSGTVTVVAGVNLHRPGEPYSIRIGKSVGGLREGSVVRYLGVPVGRVRVVDFPPDDVEAVNVEIEITKRSTPIRTGTYATLAGNFLTGETTIELLGGNNDEQRLLPASIITFRPTTLMRLEDTLPGVLDGLTHVVSDVHALFGPANQARIAKTVDDLDLAVVELRRAMDPITRDLSAMKTQLGSAGDRIADEAGALRRDVTASVASGVENLNGASASVSKVSARLTTVADNLAKATAGADGLFASVQGAADRLDRLLASADALIGDNRDEARRTLAGLRESARELEELLVTVRRDPSTLLFSNPPPERKREEGAAPSREAGR
jgi:phospholipid/cholesterol/gamma-HCH transport system substrate-binding protein